MIEALEILKNLIFWCLIKRQRNVISASVRKIPFIDTMHSIDCTCCAITQQSMTECSNVDWCMRAERFSFFFRKNVDYTVHWIFDFLPWLSDCVADSFKSFNDTWFLLHADTKQSISVHIFLLLIKIDCINQNFEPNKNHTE